MRLNLIPRIALAVVLGFALLLPSARASDCSKTSLGLVPLNELGPGLYQGFSGGLYPNACNLRPEAHERAGLEIARAIVPLNRAAERDSENGKIVLLSVGMSNTTQEFSTFQSIVARDPDKNPQLALVDGAQGGWSADRIVSGGEQYWATVNQRLARAGFTPEQVQIAWLKQADARPTLPFPEDARKLQQELKIIVLTLKRLFPNIKIVYLSSRIYAGYASTSLNPEPFAYQSGFAVKWLIEEQINGSPELNFDPDEGEVKAPWLAWGPYLWGDGLTPRRDGLIWECTDFNRDGTHPSTSGRRKVAEMLLEFFKSDSTAVPWFLARPSDRLSNFARPRGIYILDSRLGTDIDGVSMRDANIRDLSFVTGYVLRPSWAELEPAQDVYDFRMIENIIRKLDLLGQKLSMGIRPAEPSYIVENEGVASWFDSDPHVNRWRPVPWDPFLLQRMEKFIQALAEHEIDGMKLKDHPVLSTVNLGIMGAHVAIRDPIAVKIEDMPGYSRDNFKHAVLTNLRAATNNFPGKFVQIGFWKVRDSVGSPALWEEVRCIVLDEFDGARNPRVGFWMDNLAAARMDAAADQVIGFPAPEFAAPLLTSQNNTWISFQALTSWTAPFTGENKVAGAEPADGMRFAFDKYGSTYFEIYVRDIDDERYRPGFEAWHDRLFPPQVTITSPDGGARVSGTVAVTAEASDNVGVVATQFKLDGADFGAELTSPPYEVILDTSRIRPGEHTLSAVARDAAGNVARSNEVKIIVEP